jgi:exo-beta-1,3-glucanase (GH17 family)
MSKPKAPGQTAARGESPASDAAHSGTQPLFAAQGGSWSHIQPEVWADGARSDLHTAFRGVLQRGLHGLCFSPYLEGQAPGSQVSEAQIRARLKIIQPHTRWIRTFSCTEGHAQTPRIAHELGIKTLVVAWLGTDAEINERELQGVIALARAGHADIVAVGNEATVDWTDHAVPVPSMIDHVRRVKAAVRQPVTVCENDLPWQHKLREMVPELDFISLHTCPVWEYKHIHEALDYTKDNLASVARLYPAKSIGITEAGWCTSSNGRGMHAGHAVQELQAIDYADLMAWTRAEGLLCFVFEAFDESWKGSPDPLEPEKHWGLFTADRRPKLVMHTLYPDLVRQAGARSTESTA